MRFMSMVKADEAKASRPPKALFDAIGELVQEAAKDGCVMVQSGGLMPTSDGMRVRLSDGKLTVTDGPFTETKEVVGGYAIFDAKSKAHMRKWSERFMELHRVHMPGWEGECEVRQIPEPGQEPCGQTHDEKAAAV